MYFRTVTLHYRVKEFKVSAELNSSACTYNKFCHHNTHSYQTELCHGDWGLFSLSAACRWPWSWLPAQQDSAQSPHSDWLSQHAVSGCCTQEKHTPCATNKNTVSWSEIIKLTVLPVYASCHQYLDRFNVSFSLCLLQLVACFPSSCSFYSSCIQYFVCYLCFYHSLTLVPHHIYFSMLELDQFLTYR